MIKRLDKKLRMAGLEDALQASLGVGANTASWLARLAYDAAHEDGIDLLAFRGHALLTQFFRQLDRADYSVLLDRISAEAPAFAAGLAAHRDACNRAAHRQAA